MPASGLRMTSAFALLLGLFLFGGVAGDNAHAFTYDYKTAKKVYRSDGTYFYKNRHGHKKHDKAKHYGYKKKHGHAQQHGHKHHKHHTHTASRAYKQKHHGHGTRIIIVPGYGYQAQKPQGNHNPVAPQPVYKQYDKGVVADGHVGKIVAGHLTHYDRVQVNQSLETVRTGHSRSWFNDKTGKILTVSLLRTYRNEHASDCRDYRFQVKRDNHNRSIEGSACRLNNGIWKLVS